MLRETWKNDTKSIQNSLPQHSSFHNPPSFLKSIMVKKGEKKCSNWKSSCKLGTDMTIYL